MRYAIHTPVLSLAALCALSFQAQGYELYNEGGTYANAELQLGYGVFHTQRNYVGRPGSFSWREGFAQYGVNGATDRLGAGTVYGAFSLLSTATWGDGDPGGFTTGHEGRTAIEDAYVGWRSADLLPALGKDGIDLSAGRQVVQVGTGFLIMKDGVNPGKGVGNGRFDRGGAYYFGWRKAFANTALLRVGGTEGLHGSAMWLKSDNRLQANTELAAGTLDYAGAAGTLGLTYIHVLGVDKRYAIDQSRLDRRGMNVYSIRGDGNAGIKDADFAFEYARQRKKQTTETAWYAEAGYTFSDVAWKPAVSVRHTRYSKDFDTLFQGGFRGRFQGEVASNYSFSYNFNMRINDVAFAVRPSEKLSIMLMFFDYRTQANRNVSNLDAREAAIYVDWSVTDHVMITPILGVYKPRKYQGNGGNQSGSAAVNPYFKLMLTATF